MGLTWMEDDLRLANENNLTIVFFCHSADQLSPVVKDILLRYKVAVVFAGHLHRCIGPKCYGNYALNTKQAEEFLNGTTDSSTISNMGRVDKCFPASAAVCGSGTTGDSLFYLSDMKEGFVLPKQRLKSEVPIQKGVCPVDKYATYINESDNTLICADWQLDATIRDVNNTISIPIVWSGSSSFETFLKADFYADRIKINVMTATKGNEGKRYIDVHDIPNPVYSSHNRTDFEELTIFI